MQLRRSPRYTSQLERNAELHATTQEEPRFPPLQLKMSVDSPASSGNPVGNPDVAVAPQEKVGLTLKFERIPGSRASI